MPQWRDARVHAIGALKSCKRLLHQVRTGERGAGDQVSWGTRGAGNIREHWRRKENNLCESLWLIIIVNYHPALTMCEALGRALEDYFISSQHTSLVVAVIISKLRRKLRLTEVRDLPKVTHLKWRLADSTPDSRTAEPWLLTLRHLTVLPFLYFGVADTQNVSASLVVAAAPTAVAVSGEGVRAGWENRIWHEIAMLRGRFYS